MKTSIDSFERELGPEWDEALLMRLRKTVTDLGGKMKETSRRIAGSQEVIEYEILLRGETVTVTAETYMGLVLRGPHSLVEEVAGLVSRSRGDA
jgi:hypothetical protein